MLIARHSVSVLCITHRRKKSKNSGACVRKEDEASNSPLIEKTTRSFGERSTHSFIAPHPKIRQTCNGSIVRAVSHNRMPFFVQPW